jgi:hypothetical protein
MATLVELEDALRNAHSAGDQNAARRLADEIVRVRQQPSPVTSAAPETPATTTPRSNFFVEGTESIPRMLPRQRATVAGAPPRPPEPEAPKIPFASLYEDPAKTKIMENYLKASGEPVGKTPEETAKLFMSEARFNAFTSLGGIPQAARLINARDEDRTAIAKGLNLYEQTESLFSEQGQPFSPRVAADVLKIGAAETPAVVLGGVVGNIAGKATTKALTEAATQSVVSMARQQAAVGASKIPRALQSGALAATRAAVAKAPSEATAGLLGVGAAEGLYGASTEILQQRTKRAESEALKKEIERISATQGISKEEAKAQIEEPGLVVSEPTPLDLKEVASAGVFSFVLGAGLPYAAGKINPAAVKQKGDRLEEAIRKEEDASGTKRQPTPPTAPITPIEEVTADLIDENMKKQVQEYMVDFARKAREADKAKNPLAPLMDEKVSFEISRAATKVAMRVIERSPPDMFKKGPDEPISLMFNRILSRLGTNEIDDQVLQDIMVETRVNPEYLAKAHQLTIREAAQVLGSLGGNATKLSRKLKTDSAFDKLMARAYNFKTDQVQNYSATQEVMNSVLRNWTAIITTGTDTLARNIAGSTLHQFTNSAVKGVAGLHNTIGATLNAASGTRLQTFRRELGNTKHDVFDFWYYFFNQGLSRELVETAYKQDPILLGRLNSSLQETGDKKVWAITRWANAANVVIDSAYRNASAAASIDAQLRQVGKSYIKDFIITGKDVPQSVLIRAEKEAAIATYSYVPRRNDATLPSWLERKSSNAASVALGVIENNPMVGAAVKLGVTPFPRFTVNAIAHTYKNSPMGFIGGIAELRTASNIRREVYDVAEKIAKKKNISIEEAIEKDEKLQGRLLSSNILNQRAVEKNYQAAIGLGAFSFAVSSRFDNPDREWYEYEKDDGTIVDLRGFGPVVAAPFAVAEVIKNIATGLTTPKETVQDFWATVETVAGFKFRAGDNVDSFITGLLETADSEEAAKEFFVQLGKAPGEFVSGFTQPFYVKNLMDIVDAVREEGTVVRDPNVVEQESAFEKFKANFTQQITKKIPVAKEELEPAYRRLVEDEQLTFTREGQTINRLVGFRIDFAKNPLEKEITRLNLEPFRLYGRANKDKEFDRNFISTMNKVVLDRMPALIVSDEYKGLSDIAKRKRLQNEFSSWRSLATKTVVENLRRTDPKKALKMDYLSLPSVERQLIKSEYAERNPGKDLEEAEDWVAVPFYLSLIKRQTEATKNQTERMLGR